VALFGWGSAFGREPLDQYRDKERTRAGDIASERRGTRAPTIATPRRGISGGFDSLGGERRQQRQAVKAAQSIGGNIGRSLMSPVNREREEGGALGLAKRLGGGVAKYGGKALEVLDAAAETGRDAYDTGSPVGLGRLAGRAVTGDARGGLRDLAGAGGSLANARDAVRARSATPFIEGQREDLNQRGTVDRLATQLIFDPTNIVGAGVATKALRGASIARKGSITGRILGGAAKANEVADIAQSRYAREVIGGAVGYGASALSGGDTEQNLKAAGLGVLGGRASRYVGRGLDPGAVGRKFPLGAQIDDVTEGAPEALPTAPISDNMRQSATAEAPSPAASRRAKLAAKNAAKAPAPEGPLAAAGESVGPPETAALLEPNEPRQMTDMLRRRGRDAVVAEREEALGGRMERLKPQVKKNADVDAVRTEMERTEQIVREATGASVDRLKARAERAGLRIVPEDDMWVIEGTKVPIEDVAEGATAEALAVRESLSAEQRSVLDAVQAMNQRWNDTVSVHGGEVPKRATGTGEYWPRKVVGKEINEEFLPKGASKGSGGKPGIGRSRISARTQESVAAGTEAGITYAEPWDALKAGMRTKARIAQENYLARMIEPLAEKDAALRGFGARALKSNHPLLEKFKYVGTTDSGLGMVGREAFAFPDDVAGELDSLLSSTRLDQAAVGKQAAAINAVALPMRAAADISAFMNQGIGFLESNPKNFIKAFTGMGNTIASATKHPQQYYEMLEGEVARAGEALARAGVEDDPLEWLIQHGIHYADETPLQTDEYMFPASEGWKDKLGPATRAAAGVADWSNDVFARYLNYSRFTLATDQLERAVAQGKRGKALDAAMDEAGASLNRMSGWTGSKTSSLENIALFAPRFFRANIEQTIAAFTKGGLEGSIARRHLIKLTATAAVITYAANAARGYNTDVDPRSNNFLRIRNVGGQDISLLGPYATLVRAGAQAVGGQAGDAEGVGYGLEIGSRAPGPDNFDPLEAGERLLRSKSSPVMSTAWSLLSEQTYDGRPITRDFASKEFYTDTVPDIARESIPFAAQALVNQGVQPAIEQRSLKPIAEAAPGVAASFIGAQASEISPSEERNFRRDKLAEEKYGKPYEELTGEQKSIINEDEEIQENQSEAERRALETGDLSTRANADFRQKMAANGKFLADGKDSKGRVFTGNAYREAYSDAVKIRLGEMKAADEFDEDSDVSRYFDLYEEAEMANGRTDFDKLEELQADFRRKNPDIDEEVAKVTGARDDAVLREFRKAKDLATDYYAIPAFKGMALEDSQRASDVLKRADALSSTGRAASRKAALIRLVQTGEISPEEHALALRASKVGFNPARRAFRVDPDNSVFVKFYTDLTASEAEEEARFPVSGSGSSSGGSARAKPAILEKRSATSTKRRTAKR